MQRRMRDSGSKMFLDLSFITSVATKLPRSAAAHKKTSLVPETQLGQRTIVPGDSCAISWDLTLVGGKETGTTKLAESRAIPKVVSPNRSSSV